jgi:hypothetical protein
MTTYRNDPRWICAKRPGRDRNGRPFKAGERVYYYPLTKAIIAGPEADSAARDFEAARSDEEFCSGGH